MDWFRTSDGQSFTGFPTRLRSIISRVTHRDGMSVVLFFIDGLGIGRRSSLNPFDGLDDAAPLAIFEGEEPELISDGVLVRTDACLGVGGRPQSASGQTTILTGVNAPAEIGYHKQGFPNAPLLEILREHSIFRQLKVAGVGPNVFVNAYTDRFFATRPRWISATTAAVEAAGMRFSTLEDLRQGRALFHDYSNRALIERGIDVSPLTDEQAGERLARIAASNRFTLFEYFTTDKIGHAQDMIAAREVLRRLARMIRSVIAHLDLSKTTLVVTSDHGNIEDLSVRNHTRNLVPTLIWGASRDAFASRVRTLANITPAIMSLLAGSRPTPANLDAHETMGRAIQ